jgi:hypothetical protein
MADPCPIPGVGPLGSQNETSPIPKFATPLKVKGDLDSAWKPEDDILPVTPPPPGGPVPPEDGTEGVPDKNGVHQFSFQELSILCNDIGLSPEMIEGVLAQLLTQHFSDPNWIIYDELRGYTWDPAPTKRKIQILPVNKWEEVAQSKMPAVVYSDLGQSFERLAIGDNYYLDKERNFTQAYTRACRGAHRLMCIGETDYSAALLATEVGRWLTEFAPRLVSALPFHDFQVAQRETPQTFNALGGRIGVALVVQYTYIWAWELAPAGPPLKALGALPH